MAKDPDWIITIGGQDVSKFVVLPWSVKDAEEGASQIKVTLANKDGRFTDAFDYLDEMEMRFGYQGELSGPAFLPVGVIQPKWPTKGYPTITIIGCDPTQRLGGGCHRGNYKDKDSKTIIEDELKANWLSASGGQLQGAKLDNKGAMNESSHEAFYRMLPRAKGQSGGGEGGPSSPLGKEKASQAEGTEQERDQGLTWSSAAGLHEQGKDFDENRGKQANRSHGSEPLTAKLELVGYPQLKAKTCVGMQGYGSKWSGPWYAKEVEHICDRQRGYRTMAELCRGGTGQGGVGGEPPLVMYAELYQKNQVYAGPRKTEQGASHTFRYGDGTVIEFEPKLNPQPQRGAGEPKKGKGRGLDIRDALKEMEFGPGAEGGGE